MATRARTKPKPWEPGGSKYNPFVSPAENRRYARQKAVTYYCKACKRRHSVTSKIGMQHNWNLAFLRKHPNNRGK